jgi:hypothetical protein
MEIAWGMFTNVDGSSHRQIQISEDSDWLLFNRVAGLLEVGLHGRWTEQLDGPDQRYWDLSVQAGQLTLHLEHYLGITLYSAAGKDADSESLVLLEKAYNLLAGYEPA